MTGTPRSRGRRLAWVTLVAVGGALPLGACWVERVPETERQERSVEGIRRSVQEMLDVSAAAWNDGRIEDFMDDYVNSSSTTYIGGDGLIEGWDAIYERYEPMFAPGAERDSLAFEEVKVRRLSATLALAISRYRLFADDGRITASGPFTLVLRKAGREWRIIHDHTSSDPRPVEP